MYVLTLGIVFILVAYLEWLNHGLTIASRGSCHDAAARLQLMALHALRVALALIVMLAAMSFNVGVLMAAVLAHALGFFLFGSSGMQEISQKGDSPPMSSV
ncbi:copper transporter 6-like [Phoenix dactylifera]|uniref:Copper transport protein n=1 Tax=Phoenix dactylifera TaxID=42345 RepID=A0A8B8Z946_PHODC|nr:copper transporter 6-like [Phoenix dactylifera]